VKIDGAEWRQALALVGLGTRGRLTVVGVEQVRSAALRGKLEYAVVALDASHHSLKKIVPMLAAKRIGFAEGPSAVELGKAVGKDSAAVVGIVDPQLAAGLRRIVDPGPAGAR
jgi:ribosomal protein L7Ae-like RNA K-turn-binding protein